MKLRSKSNDKYAAVLMYNQLLRGRLNKSLLSPQIIWSSTTDSKFYINLIHTLFILCTYIYQNLTLLFICPNLKVAVTPGLQSVISVCAAVTHWHLHQPDVHSPIQLAFLHRPVLMVWHKGRREGSKLEYSELHVNEVSKAKVLVFIFELSHGNDSPPSSKDHIHSHGIRNHLIICCFH